MASEKPLRSVFKMRLGLVRMDLDCLQLQGRLGGGVAVVQMDLFKVALLFPAVPGEACTIAEKRRSSEADDGETGPPRTPDLYLRAAHAIQLGSLN